MSNVVSGSISVSSGWWIELPEPYSLHYDEAGSMILESEVEHIEPHVFSFDASAMVDSASSIAREIIFDTVADLSDVLAVDDSITGRGWTGALCTAMLTPGSEERQLTASLAEINSIMNVTIDYLSDAHAERAYWLIDHVVHRPDTAMITNELARTRSHLSMP